MTVTTAKEFMQVIAKHYEKCKGIYLHTMYTLDGDATTAERRMIMTEFITRNYGQKEFEVIIKTDRKEHYKAAEYFARNLIDHAKPQTNADRIRAMSDEELAKEILFFCPTDTVFKGKDTYGKPHYTGLDGRYYATSEEVAASNLEWLQQPAE